MDKKRLPSEYEVTPERAEIVKQIDLKLLKSKLPTGYGKRIRELLLEKGFDYNTKYIYNCLNDDKPIINHYVIQASIKITIELDNPFDSEEFDEQLKKFKK